MKERGEGKRKGGDSAVGSGLLSKGGEEELILASEEGREEGFSSDVADIAETCEIYKDFCKKGLFFKKKVPNGALVNYIPVK